MRVASPSATQPTHASQADLNAIVATMTGNPAILSALASALTAQGLADEVHQSIAAAVAKHGQQQAGRLMAGVVSTLTGWYVPSSGAAPAKAMVFLNGSATATACVVASYVLPDLTAGAQVWVEPVNGARSDLLIVGIRAFVGTPAAAAAKGVAQNILSFGAVCDGVTDDTNAWLLALSAASGVGGVVLHPGGVSRTSASLVLLSDNITIRGNGYGSVIKPLSGATFDVISTPIPASSGASGYTRSYCGVENIKIDCSAMSGTVAGQGNGIHFYGVRYGFIRNTFITGCPNYCIVLDGDSVANFGYNTEVRRAIFDVCAAGIYVTGSEAHDIVENLFKFAGASLAAAQPTFNSPSTVARHLTLTGGYAYVAGNVFGNGGAYTTEAIAISSGAPCRIIGNRFDSVHAEAIHTTAGSHLIEANTFTSCESTVAGKATVSLGSAGNIVKGNEWDASNGAFGGAYCVQENGLYSPGNLIEGNLFLTGSSGVVSLNAATTSQARNNIGYNPVGSLTTPTMPTSGTAYTNAFGVESLVCVSGGSVTVIAVAGVATGLTSGAFRVAPGQTITITYSAAPGWSWIGD